MNKVLFQIGLLTFCISIVYFGVQDIPVIDLLSRSFIIFVGVVAGGVLVVLSVRMFATEQERIISNQNQVSKNDTKSK